MRREGAPASDPLQAHDLSALARRLTVHDVQRAEAIGDTVEALLRAASKADLLVVGCRSMGPAQRMVVGSTSRAVASWSPVPTVVVPEAWMQPSMATAPIVAGIRPVGHDAPEPSQEPDREVLDVAFARAAALHVPLALVSAFEIPSLLEWSAADIAQARAEKEAALDRVIAPWRERYPDVDAVVACAAEKPGQALLDASKTAQLVVVGRHHSDLLTGLLGGTARGVLHRATRPVVVVPSGTREQLVRDLEVQYALPVRGWGPTF